MFYIHFLGSKNIDILAQMYVEVNFEFTEGEEEREKITSGPIHFHPQKGSTKSAYNKCPHLPHPPPPPHHTVLIHSFIHSFMSACVRARASE